MKPKSEEVQRRMAADREKERMKALNSAFEQLRKKLKTNNGKKLTKIRTLRLAISYIEQLQTYLYGGGDGEKGSTKPDATIESDAVEDRSSYTNETFGGNRKSCENQVIKVSKLPNSFPQLDDYVSLISSSSSS